MKKILIVFCMILFVAVVAIPLLVSAGDGLPEDVYGFEYGGKYCLWDVKERVLLQPCWCINECEDICNVPTVVPYTPTPTDDPNGPTPTSPPVHTEVPNTPTPEPSSTPPPPQPTPTPKVDKPKANCGLGNLEEGADPNENACGKKTGEENEPDGPPGQNK